MSQRKNPARRAGTRKQVTANMLIAEVTSTRFRLTEDQVEQVRILLEHNDACDTPRRKVSLVKAWRFLKDHYGLKMGIHMLERLVCESFERTSWGQP